MGILFSTAHTVPSEFDGEVEARKEVVTKKRKRSLPIRRNAYLEQTPVDRNWIPPHVLQIEEQNKRARTHQKARKTTKPTSLFGSDQIAWDDICKHDDSTENETREQRLTAPRYECKTKKRLQNKSVDSLSQSINKNVKNTKKKYVEERLSEESDGEFIFDNELDGFDPFSNYIPYEMEAAEITNGYFQDSSDLSGNLTSVEEEESILEKGLILNDGVVKRWSCRSGFIFYPDAIHQQKLEELLISEPQRYKRCELTIEGAHLAICKPIALEQILSIEISGRSKCGKSFSGDEVVVEILNDPTKEQTNFIPRLQKNTNSELKYYGKVLGKLRSPILDKSKHPVFVCDMDDQEYHLMRPMCRSIPKLRLLQGNGDKFGVDLYRYDAHSQELVHKSVKHINPAHRKNYIFVVVYIRWDLIYPTGAVVKIIQSDGKIQSSLSILELKYRIPKFHSAAAKKRSKKLAKSDSAMVDYYKCDRCDITEEVKVFTIDPPDSKDLDDALSIEQIEQGFRVGVHIADVSSYIQKGYDVDTDAYRRATTFYPGQGINPYHMLPLSLSTDTFSLIPNKKRRAISVYFNINTCNNKTEVSANVEVKRTLIKSSRQFTYTEVQAIIMNKETDDDKYSADLTNLFFIAKKLRFRRLGESIHALPVDIDISGEPNDTIASIEAHYLVEEFMILTNYHIGNLLFRRYPTVVPLRCQDPPSHEQACDWLHSHPRIAHIILKLQNIQPIPGTSLSVSNMKEARYRVYLGFQKWVISNIEKAVLDGRYKDAWKLIGTDDLHPEQSIAYQEWISFQESAEYRCSDPERKIRDMTHFSLGIGPYVHFTSPIRRYADIINHRLLQAAIDNKPCPYEQREIIDMCKHINEMSRKAKHFQKQCSATLLANKLKTGPILVYAFVEKVTESGISFIVPGFRGLPASNREIGMNILGLSRQPEIREDKDDDRNFLYATLKWKLRLYSHAGYSPSPRIQTSDTCLRIDPHQHTRFDQFKRWVDILKAKFKTDNKILSSLVALGTSNYMSENSIRSYVPTCTDTVPDVSSEVRGGPVVKQFCNFSMSFSQAQVINVQIGAEAERGSLVPTPELLNMTNNVKICLQHPVDPIKYMSSYAMKHALPPHMKYPSVPSYLEIWSPLVEMEAVVTAARESPVTINDVPVRFDQNGGMFTLKNPFCLERDIEFHDSSMDFVFDKHLKDLEEVDENEHQYVPSADYVCIKTTVKDFHGTMYGDWNDAPGCTRVWIAHGIIDNCIRQTQKEQMKIHFKFHPTSPRPLSDMEENTTLCNIEIMKKSNTFRRVSALLDNLKRSSTLTQALALGLKIPELDDDHKEIGRIMQKDVLLEGMPANNQCQLDAIQKALTSRFSLIQGPPGTGKTYTAMKLLYLFTKINKTRALEGFPKKTIVFCGPSNKSVDLVAKWAMNKLGDYSPRMVRIYGSSLEAVDFPIPGKTYTFGGESRPDRHLKDITLHHIIRREGEPFAEELKKYHTLFKKVNENPNRYEVREYQHNVKEYRKISNKASIEELKHYDVIFCTTALTLNPKVIEGTRGSIFQLIMDESGMTTEPEAISTIMATKAQQVVLIGDHQQLQPVVVCQHAAKLGLERSLFERYSHHSRFLTILKIQYRMNPKICDIVSQEFYKNQLQTDLNVKSWRENVPLSIWVNCKIPHVFCHVEGKEHYLSVNVEEGNERSRGNREEAEKVAEIYIRLLNTENISPKHVNIMTQYNNQCHVIKEMLDSKGYIHAHINTVVKSQGGEWDYVIFSTVRSLPDYKIESRPTLGWCKMNLGFINDRHQINVALSRAKKGLFIVGNKRLLSCNQVFRNLLDMYRKRGCLCDADSFPPKLHRVKPYSRRHHNRKMYT